MKELTRVQTSKLIGGTAQCDRIGARMTKLYEKGRDATRNARRYYNLGCVVEPANF